QLPAGDRQWLDLDLPAAQRGRFETLAIEIRSLYPLGFFTASVRFVLPLIHYIYPQPEGDALLPGSTPNSRASETSPQSEGGDSAGPACSALCLWVLHPRAHRAYPHSSPPTFPARTAGEVAGPSARRRGGLSRARHFARY